VENSVQNSISGSGSQDRHSGSQETTVGGWNFPSIETSLAKAAGFKFPTQERPVIVLDSIEAVQYKPKG
jgi:hypothetical protein